MPELISDGATGAEIADAIVREAQRRGVAVERFAGALSLWPAKWLAQLRIATRPKKATIDRVRALFAGEEVAPPPENNFWKSARDPTRAAVMNRVAVGPPTEQLPPRIDRDPCPRCGVRGDLGCGHTASRLVFREGSYV